MNHPPGVFDQLLKALGSEHDWLRAQTAMLEKELSSIRCSDGVLDHASYGATTCLPPVLGEGPGLVVPASLRLGVTAVSRNSPVPALAASPPIGSRELGPSTGILSCSGTSSMAAMRSGAWHDRHHRPDCLASKARVRLPPVQSSLSKEEQAPVAAAAAASATGDVQRQEESHAPPGKARTRKGSHDSTVSAPDTNTSSRKGSEDSTGPGAQTPSPMRARAASASTDGGQGRFAVKPDEEKASRSSFVAFAVHSPASAFKAAIHSVAFETLSGSVILVNALFLGLETEHLATHQGKAASSHLSIHMVFNAFFFGELVVRIAADRLPYFYNKDWRWNWLDFILVSTSMIDLFIAVSRFDFAAAGRALRAVRLLRLMRTLRLFRTMKAIREFHKMLFAIISSMRTLLCSLVILFFVIFFFSVLVCQGVTDFRYAGGGTEIRAPGGDLVDMYGSLSKTFYTLFAAVAQGLSWQLTMDPLASLPSVYSAAMLIYIALVLFGVSNVVTSVFVESAVMSAQHYRELIVQEKQHRKELAVMHMREVFKHIDVDGSGEISMEEMEYFLTEPSLLSYVEALGISADSTRMLFRLLDGDDSGRIDTEEFCEGCLRLQGEAKSIDIHTLIYQVKQFLTKWSEFTDYVEERMDDLTSLIVGQDLLEGQEQQGHHGMESTGSMLSRHRRSRFSCDSAG